MKNKFAKIALAEQLSIAWEENEELMGEQAAYMVSCEQLGIDPDEGYELLALIAREEKGGWREVKSKSEF